MEEFSNLSAFKRKRLEAAWEKASQNDSRFFKNNLDRNTRIRRATRGELEMHEACKKTLVTHPGMEWFTVTRQVVPGVRIRVFTQFWEDAPVDNDVTEWEAANVYDQIADGRDLTDFENRLRDKLPDSRRVVH